MTALHFSRTGRVKRDNRCPVCGHSDWCQFDDTGFLLHCMRSNSAPAGWLYLKQANDGGYLFKSVDAPDERRPIVTITGLATRPKTPIPTPSPCIQGEGRPEAGLGVQEPERADPATLDTVYCALLAGLNLNPQHRTMLATERHMSEAEIRAFGAKSAPERDIELCRELARRFGGDTLLSVPGFYRDPRSGLIRLNVPRHALLIPGWRDPYATGIQVRPDTPGDGPKYYWLSSNSERLHRLGVGGPGAWLQAAEWWPLGGTQRPNIVGITEGAFKGFRAAQVLGYPFLSLPGVSTGASAGVVELAQQIAGAGGTAVIFFDSEPNPNTRRHRDMLGNMLANAGLRVEIATWPQRHKGIDDLLLAGGTFATESHLPTELPVDTLLSARFLPPLYVGQTTAPTNALEISHRVTLLKSGKGSGKTEQVAQLIATLPATATILLIGHRVALLRELARRFGLALYLDYKGVTVDRKGLAEARRLAICADSLVHLDAATLPAYDYIIMDESEQELRHLTSSTVAPKRKSVWVTQNALLKRAGRIICMDADMSALTYRYMAHLFDTGDIGVIENSYARSDMPPVYAYAGTGAKHALYAALLGKLRAGVRCFVASNSASAAHMLERLIHAEMPQLSILCISQETGSDPAVVKLLSDMNAYAPAYDCLITSPTVNTGLDISVDHFAATFVIGVRGSTTHSDLLQHMARNRKAQEIHAYIVPGISEMPTDPAYWRTECITKHHATSLLVEYDDAGERIAAAHEQEYLALWADIKAAEAASRNDLAGNFYRQAQAEGHRVVPAIANPASVAYADLEQAQEAAIALETGNAIAQPAPEAIGSTRMQVSTTRDAIRNERQQAVLAAPDLLPSEAAKFEIQGCRNATERASLERYRIGEFYNLPVDAALVELDGGGKLMHRLTNLMALTGQIDPVARDTKQIASAEQMLPDLRHLTGATAMRRKVLRAAGLLRADGSWDTATVLSTEKLERFTGWVLEKHNARRIKRWLGLTVKRDVAEKPVELVAAVLAQCGLTLDHKRSGPRTERHWLARLDPVRLSAIQRLAHARAERLSGGSTDLEEE